MLRAQAGMNHSGGALHVAAGLEVLVHELFGFRMARGGDGGLSHQIAHRGRRVGGEEGFPTSRGHYWIDDEWARVAPLEDIRHGHDEVRVKEQSGLRCPGWQIACHALNLMYHKVGRKGLNVCDTLRRTVGGHSEGRHSVGSQRGEGFQICLHARPAAGVAPRHGEDSRCRF